MRGRPALAVVSLRRPVQRRQGALDQSALPLAMQHLAKADASLYLLGPAMTIPYLVMLVFKRALLCRRKLVHGVEVLL